MLITSHRDTILRGESTDLSSILHPKFYRDDQSNLALFRSTWPRVAHP